MPETARREKGLRGLLHRLVTPPPHLGRDQSRRYVLTGWMFLAGFLLLGFFIPFDLFYTAYVHHAVAEAVTLVLLVAAFVHYRRTARPTLTVWGASITVAVLIVFLILSGRPADTVAAWAAFYPAIPFFLLGARHGLMLVLAFTAALAAGLVWMVQGGGLSGISTVAIFNTVGATLGTGAILYYYEHGRASSARVLEQAANTDFLTGVANRRHFQVLFGIESARARRHHRPLTLLLADLDHFKAVNDTYGHDVGDIVIRHAARVMVDSLRREDIVGRIGGEEFAVLLPDTDLPAAATVAEALRRAMEQSSPHPGVTVTVSIGIAEMAWGEDFSTVFANADGRLYEAKAAGRNRVAGGLDGKPAKRAAE